MQSSPNTKPRIEAPPTPDRSQRGVPCSGAPWRRTKHPPCRFKSRPFREGWEEEIDASRGLVETPCGCVAALRRGTPREQRGLRVASEALLPLGREVVTLPGFEPDSVAQACCRCTVQQASQKEKRRPKGRPRTAKPFLKTRFSTAARICRPRRRRSFWWFHRRS